LIQLSESTNENQSWLEADTDCIARHRKRKDKVEKNLFTFRGRLKRQLAVSSCVPSTETFLHLIFSLNGKSSAVFA